MKFSILNVVKFLGCIVVFILMMYASRSAYSYFLPQSSQRTIYDSKLESPKVSWAGPLIGEILPLERLKTQNERSFVMRENSKLLIFLVINPGCIVCQTTTDQMSDIEKFAMENQIGFFVASFSNRLSVGDLLVFRDSAGLTSDVYSFDGHEREISPNTVGLQYPSYILTNGSGKILRIFAGSHPDESIRKTMTKQIMDETLVEVR